MNKNKLKKDFPEILDEFEKKDISRKDFLKLAGVFVVSTTFLNGCIDGTVCKGYIVVDSKKCQGCQTCMTACSMVHEGTICPSLSRIQVVQDPFACWPHDINIEQCRQCREPECVDACPSGALIIDEEHGNIRRVAHKENCTGCGLCVEACSNNPKKTMLKLDQNSGADLKAMKCDLCVDTPYHYVWDSYNGDPSTLVGKQACVLACPVNAIKFITTVPLQCEDSGYEVNLRGPVWGSLGFPRC